MNCTVGNNYNNIGGLKMLLLSPNKHETKLSNYSQNVFFFFSTQAFTLKFKVVLAIVMQQNGCCSNEER